MVDIDTSSVNKEGVNEYEEDDKGDDEEEDNNYIYCDKDGFDLFFKEAEDELIDNSEGNIHFHITLNDTSKSGNE